MTLFCADFIVGKDGKVWFGLVASLTALSASSLLMISLCPDIYISEISIHEFCCCTDSNASSTEVSIDWPECCTGFAVAFIVGWLSMYMMHCLYICEAN